MLTDKLTNIANAIREKGGTTEKLTLDAMPTAISALSTGGGGGVDIPDEAFVISGDCSYWAYHGLWDKFIIAYANKWSTSDITDTSYMFSYSKLETIPFEINCISRISYISSSNMYAGNSKLIELSAINNLKVYNISMMFYNCERLRTIPENYADTWDWTYLEGQTSAYGGNMKMMFAYCYSLRSIPMNIIKSGNPYGVNSYAYFYSAFTSCYVLDELNNLPMPYTKATWTSNTFNETFKG